ncbi:gag-pol polyprotein [Lasius niger]|uniref:Gag-pol polyprotein n=1 Tax=Lasius niger TaxID=67767 RepID=A0A0J7KYH2_LASNI|nr:gag-pol polyprotein [Lasius niger]
MGPNGAAKAMDLQGKLHEVLKDKARVTRPVTQGKIRLIGLHDATSPDEIAQAVMGTGGCIWDDIKVGVVRSMNNGLFTVWIQCPLGAAVKMANRRRVSIGWTQVRVELLSSRPTQCFRCWKFDHLKSNCRSGDNFSRLCFRCGGKRHAARNCVAPPAYKICMSEGRAHDHRLGSELCPAGQNSTRARPAPATAEPTTVPGTSWGEESMSLDGR